MFISEPIGGSKPKFSQKSDLNQANIELPVKKKTNLCVDYMYDSQFCHPNKFAVLWTYALAGLTDEELHGYFQQHLWLLIGWEDDNILD